MANLAEGRNSPADWARELFRSLKYVESLVSIWKKCERFGFLLFYQWHYNGNRFMHILT